MVDTVQVTRTYRNFRTNQAWWTAKKQEDSSWRVNFHADCVPSASYVVTSDAELFRRIEQDHTVWMAAVDNQWARK
jgi:hypothetical protein